MRNFTSTLEPSGDDERPSRSRQRSTPTASATGGRFVVQRHRATALHYDFRLEIDGVLVSWAVPKGPSLDPADKHLAVHVEDHPLDYIDFEGTIPAGEYGGGDVIVWDTGTWSLHKGTNASTSLKKGDLHIEMFGHKLAGRFALVRRGEAKKAPEQWLLIHARDDFSLDGWDIDDSPGSVLTGRTNDEVAQGLISPASDDEMAALADLPKSGGLWDLQGRQLKLSNLDKVLFSKRGRGKAVTKRDMIAYYVTIAPTMVPYLRNRPLNMHRFPDGVDKAGFWHKAVPDHAPAWIQRWHFDEAKSDKTEWYAVMDSVAAMAWAANFGVVEFHAWTSTIQHPRQPTWALIDLDPGTKSTFDDVLTLARLHRTALEHLQVTAQPKVTGQRGIQIWVPVQDGLTFDETRAWVEALSRAIGQIVPELVSWSWTKDDRLGLARLDYTQNAINKTLVAPYSLRAAAGAPASVPIEWDELDDAELAPDRWTIRDVAKRVAQTGDLFEHLLTIDQQLPSL